MLCYVVFWHDGAGADLFEFYISFIGLGELAFVFVPFFGSVSHTPLSVL